MGFRQLILVLTITVSILIMSLLGVSYAWYSFSDPESQFEVSTVGDDFGVVFAQSSYISLGSAIPISESDAPQKAGISRFSITSENTEQPISIVIKLVNIQMDDAFKNADFRVQLFEDNTIVYDGTGLEISGDSIVLKDVTEISVGTTKNYELRIWILETEYDQNSFMGKNFSGQIQVSSLSEK